MCDRDSLLLSLLFSSHLFILSSLLVVFSLSLSPSSPLLSSPRRQGRAPSHPSHAPSSLHIPPPHNNFPFSPPSTPTSAPAAPSSSLGLQHPPARAVICQLSTPTFTRSLPLHPCDTRPTHSFVCASPLRLLQPFFLRPSRLPRGQARLVTSSAQDHAKRIEKHLAQRPPFINVSCARARTAITWVLGQCTCAAFLIACLLAAVCGRLTLQSCVWEIQPPASVHRCDLPSLSPSPRTPSPSP